MRRGRHGHGCGRGVVPGAWPAGAAAGRRFRARAEPNTRTRSISSTRNVSEVVTPRLLSGLAM